MKCNNGHFDKDIRSSGITTVDADFQVFSSDIEDEDNRTEFNNQKFGITALKTIGGLRSLKVSNALFDNCQYGIRSEMATGDAIANNLFKVQDDTEEGDPINHLGKYNTRYGVYELRSLSYDIFDNTFTSKTGSNSGGIHTYGSVVQGYYPPFPSGAGLIANNSFEKLKHATQTEFNNWYTRITCNAYGEGINNEWRINPVSVWGTMHSQGTNCQNPGGIRAGNTFADPALAIDDHSNNAWKYWGSGTANSTTVPSSNVPSIPQPCGLTSDEPCSTGDGDGDPYLVYNGQRWTAKSQLDILNPELDDAIANLDQGQTTTLLANIANSSYSNSTLYADLQSAALLSDEVLTAVWGRYPTFTQNQLFSIMIANSPVSPGMWETIVDECDKLSYNYDTLAYAQAFNTVRTVQRIKWDIEAAESDWHHAAAGLMKYYATADSTEEMHDTLFAYLTDTLGTKSFKKLAMGYGLEIGRVADARAVLENLDIENAYDSSFYHYYDLAVSLAEDSLTWFGMDSTQKAKVRAIAETEFDEAYNAQAVLALIGDVEYTRTPELLAEELNRVEEAAHLSPQNELAAKQVVVYPNPFENSFNVSYTLDEEAAELKIEVYDVVGRAIKDQNIRNAQNGNLTMDLGQCLGVYFVRVSSGNKQLFNGKMICLNK
jgi:hypothetical protein